MPPTIVVATSKKGARLLRMERFFAKPRKPSPEIEAFFARMPRPLER